MTISLHWIWPFCWYSRIKQLEAELEQQRRFAREAQRREIELMYRHNLEMQQMAATYTAVLNGILSSRS
jgi:hypothetical protein